jgi:hypothetical protein
LYSFLKFGEPVPSNWCNSLFDEGLCCNIKVQIFPPVLPGSEFRPNLNVFNLLIDCLSNLSKTSGLTESGISKDGQSDIC